jgi:hypothetical protein
MCKLLNNISKGAVHLYFFYQCDTWLNQDNHSFQIPKQNKYVQWAANMPTTLAVQFTRLAILTYM